MSQPEAENWLEVHFQFMRGSENAWEKIAKYFLPCLIQRLSSCRPRVDAHLVAESAENALLDYRKSPQRFDATRSVPLGHWLLLQARGHLSNLLRRERRHWVHEKAVGVADKIFEKFLSQMGVERTIIIRRDEDETTEQRRRTLNSLLLRLNPVDRAEVELLRREKVLFEEWVAQLGIASLSTAEQHHRVNAEKARLKKKLRRLVRKDGNGSEEARRH